jgi:hypothetical protein
LRRAALLWLVLVGAYATTLGLDAAGGAPFAPGEARVLLMAESLVSDGDLDLRDEYRDGVADGWTAAPLQPVAGLTDGRLHEPPGAGLALLIAPGYALAGPTGAQLVIAALLALGFVAAAALARRVVPDPWATGAALTAGLSAPALGWGTAIAAEPVGAAAVAGAALFTLRVRTAPTIGRAALAALLIGLLPWLSVKLVPVAVVCAAALARWLRRRSRSLAAFAALELVLIPWIALVSVNERLYGGLTPYDAVAGSPTGASGAAEHAERFPRLVSALFDPSVGLLVWAPAGVLAFLALELLTRSVRDRLHVALPEVVDVEVTAGFFAVLCGAQLLVAAFLAPTLEGDFFPGRDLVPILPVGAALCAWGLRHAPRAGGALVALTLAAGAWVLLGGWVGGATLAPPSGPLPWAGAEVAVTALVAVALVALLAREVLRDRELRA